MEKHGHTAPDNKDSSLGGALKPIRLAKDEQMNFQKLMVEGGMTGLYNYLTSENDPAEQEIIAEMIAFADKCWRAISAESSDFMQSTLTDQIHRLNVMETKACELVARLTPEVGGVANIRCVHFYKTPHDIPDHFDWESSRIETIDTEAQQIVRGQLYEVMFPERCAQPNKPFRRLSEFDISYGSPCIVLIDSDYLYWIPMDLVIELV